MFFIYHAVPVHCFSCISCIVTPRVQRFYANTMSHFKRANKKPRVMLPCM